MVIVLEALLNRRTQNVSLKVPSKIGSERDDGVQN